LVNRNSISGLSFCAVSLILTGSRSPQENIAAIGSTVAVFFRIRVWANRAGSSMAAGGLLRVKQRTSARLVEEAQFLAVLPPVQGRKIGDVWRQWRIPKWRAAVDEDGHYCFAGVHLAGWWDSNSGMRKEKNPVVPTAFCTRLHR
jgi:hypothetical protein